MSKETKIAELNDEELDQVTGGEKLIYITKRADGKYNAVSGIWKGDINKFKELGKGEIGRQIRYNEGILPEKIEAFKEKYKKDGYTFI